ncbi:MAG: fumarylacetoacetate hydrolase family protein [Porphyromonadaceae bacterium]|jgi:2-keto-4-pentenoate hydratase/2-oxohepta-3-ene-1,7-dioic acid hydratase in catechol pathway|nr:fumarylacetoacetate hydrolase family protein [Porphyromonadaceae bacterium]
MKIFAIGQNYVEHNKELNSPNPNEPIVFMKADTSALRDNKPFFLPGFSDEIHYETELLVKINRIGKNISPKFAHRYYDEIGLGVDFTARDLQWKLKKEGKPWEICKAFDNSAVIGKFLQKTELDDIQNLHFHMKLNEEIVQKGFTGDMIFSVSELIAYISKFFTLKIGDVIFTGTPVGVGKVKIGDRLQGFLSDKKMFDFQVK